MSEPVDPQPVSAERTRAIVLEAARRATWDALQGPRYLQSGRFQPKPDDKPS